MKIELINDDCLNVMKSFEDNIIDLTVTSPPYDNLRTYNNSLEWGEHIWKPIIEQLYRITKKGGVVVWVVGDATIKGSETGTSFKQALYFKDVGFNLHDTMIYAKNSTTFPSSYRSNRYTQIFEYMFIFAKGKIKTSNLIRDKKNKYFGYKDYSGKLKNTVPEYSPRTNIWNYITSYNDRTEHPAVFPEQLANDHIISWSNENDIIFDPFMGSGTTGKIAILNNRNFIGIEKEKTYFEIAKKRIEKYNET